MRTLKNEIKLTHQHEILIIFLFEILFKEDATLRMQFKGRE